MDVDTPSPRSQSQSSPAPASRPRQSAPSNKAVNYRAPSESRSHRQTRFAERPARFEAEAEDAFEASHYQPRRPLNLAPSYSQQRSENGRGNGKIADGGLPGDRNRRQTRDADKMQKVMEKMHAEWRAQNQEFQRSWDKIARKIDVDVSKDLHTTQNMLKENVFQPGDFVQVRERMGAYLMGVVVPPPPDNEGPSDAIHVLGVSGMVHSEKREDVLVHFPSMLDPKMCARAGPASYAHVSGGQAMFESAGMGSAPMIQEGTEPFDLERFRARVGLMTVLRIFRQRVHQGTLLLQNAFTELYGSRALLAAKNADNVVDEPLAQRRVTVHEAAKKLLAHLDFGPEADVSRSLYVATHQFFFHVPEMYAIDGNTYRTSQAYTARPLEETLVIQQVTEWTRGLTGDQPHSEGAKIVEGFVSRIKKVLAWRRENEGKLDAEQAQLKRGEMKAVPVPGLEWTKEDHSIFRFLQLLLLQGRYLQSDIVTSPAMAIIKLIMGPMPMDLLSCNAPAQPRSVTHNYPMVPPSVTHASITFAAVVTRWLLEQVGVVAPWQSLVAELHDFPSEAEVVAQVRAELNAAGTKGAQPKLHLEPLDQVDRRKRFSHPVYVIDDADARELDDGISLVPIDGSEDIWLHVHIADPTTYFTPDSALGRAAEQQSSTLYYPDKSYPLLPEEVFEALPGLALSSDEPQRAMTFSVRLTPEGKPVEYDVSLTLLEDVRTKLYDDVDALLALPEASVEPAQKQDWAVLGRLRRFLFEVQKRRWANHAHLNAPFANPVVETPDLLLPSPPGQQKGVKIYLGDPGVSMKAQAERPLTPEEEEAGYPFEPARAEEWGAREMVAESMLLAGRVAGKWGADKKLALPYNGLEPPDKHRFLELVKKHPSRYGAMTRRVVLQLNTLVTYTSPHPVQQCALGFDPLPFLPQGERDALTGSGYVRVTSPMRRYADMVAHWQIRHLLEGGQSTTAPWSYEQMAALCPRLDESARRVKALQRSGISFWSAYYLQGIVRRGGPDPRLDPASEEAQVQQRVLAPRPAWVISNHVRVDAEVFANTRVHVRGLGVAAETRLPIDLMAKGADAPGAQLSQDLLAGRYSITDLVQRYPHMPDLGLGREVTVQLVAAICLGPTNYFHADLMPLRAEQAS